MAHLTLTVLARCGIHAIQKFCVLCMICNAVNLQLYTSLWWFSTITWGQDRGWTCKQLGWLRP